MNIERKPPKTCKFWPECREPVVPTKGRCRRHQNEYQRSLYRRHKSAADKRFEELCDSLED